jgi:hypothetical protein
MKLTQKSTPKFTQPFSLPLAASVGTVFIIAYRECTTLLEASLKQEGFRCVTLRQTDSLAYQNFASAHRCLLNHQTAWRKAAQAKTPTLIVEADFVPVVGIGQLPFPLPTTQAGMAWLYTCAPQLYSVTVEGFGEGFSTSLVAYVITPEAAQCLCDNFVEQITANYGTGYHTFDSEIDRYLRTQGFKNYVPFRNYGDHGGKPNPEHRRNGMSRVHHADVLYGKLAFTPMFLRGSKHPQLKMFQARVYARLKGIARLVLGKYLRLAIVKRSSVPLRLIRFAISRHLTFNLP